MAAAKWIAKLGADALKPRKLESGKWAKPVVSALQAARLRKQYYLEGKEWPFPEPEKQHKPVKLKGHKRDKIAAQRQEIIAKNMEEMPKRIAEYRESRKIKNVSLFDKLFLPPGLIREKYRKAAAAKGQ